MLSSATACYALAQSHCAAADKPLIVILGPTASGKTDFSINLALHLGHAEIVNADSRQLYKYMNIGTAKITDDEKRGVVHHLLDMLEPTEDVNIAWYKEQATAIIEDCHRRKVIPILVGGSMLYISAIVDGLDPLPPVDPEVRERLEKEWDKDDGWVLYDKLVALDPATAKSFEHQNKRYVVRALELYEKTGIPPSQLKKTIPPPYQILQFGMQWPRELLTERIDRRTKQLLENGWIREVEGLLDRGFTSRDPGMKSHGYAEIMQWLQYEEQDKDALAEKISIRTRQYAKRQMTWWGDDDRIHWINAQQL